MKCEGEPPQNSTGLHHLESQQINNNKKESLNNTNNGEIGQNKRKVIDIEEKRRQELSNLKNCIMINLLKSLRLEQNNEDIQKMVLMNDLSSVYKYYYIKYRIIYNMPLIYNKKFKRFIFKIYMKIRDYLYFLKNQMRSVSKLTVLGSELAPPKVTKINSEQAQKQKDKRKRRKQREKDKDRVKIFNINILEPICYKSSNVNILKKVPYNYYILSWSERMQMKKRDFKLYLYYESFYKEAQMSFILISETSIEKTVAIEIEIIHCPIIQESTCKWTLEIPAPKEDQITQPKVFIPFEKSKLPVTTVCSLGKDSSESSQLVQSKKIQEEVDKIIGNKSSEYLQDSYFLKLKNDAINLLEYYFKKRWYKEQQTLLRNKLDSIFFYLKMTNKKLPTSSLLCIYSIYHYIFTSTDLSIPVLGHTLHQFYLYLILFDKEITRLPRHRKFRKSLLSLDEYIKSHVDEYNQALEKYILRNEKWNGN